MTKVDGNRGALTPPRPGVGWVREGALRIHHELENAPIAPPRPGVAGRGREPRSKPRLRASGWLRARG